MTEPDFLRATRASYDAMAEDYAEWVRGELDARPLERALLAAFAELVRAGGGGLVADVGCGTGRVTAYLHGLGLDVSGIDLSPGMLAVARKAHPELRFQEGSMLALDLPDASVAGVLAWYSIIHVPRELLPDAFAEFRRVLAPGGHLLLGFQAGSDTSHRSEARGHAIDLDFRRQEPDRIAELLTRAGLAVHARLTRERDTDSEFPEKTAQGFVLARKQLSAQVVDRTWNSRKLSSAVGCTAAIRAEWKAQAARGVVGVDQQFVTGHRRKPGGVRGAHRVGTPGFRRRRVNRRGAYSRGAPAG